MILEDRFTVAISFCKRYTIALFKIYNNYQLIRFFKYSKGVFDLYSFEKINDKYSLVNYHSKINRYKMPDDSSYNSGIRNLYSAYNKTANKTFYLLNISPREYQDGIVICNELNFEYFARPKITRGMFGYTPILGTLYQVYAITDGEPVDVIHVEMNGQTKTFQK